MYQAILAVSPASDSLLTRQESGLFLLNLRPCKFDAIGRARVLNTAHAADQVERIPIQASVLDVRIIDMNRDHLANHQTAARWGRREIENLVQLAFETDRRFRHPCRSYQSRG